MRKIIIPLGQSESRGTQPEPSKQDVRETFITEVIDAIEARRKLLDVNAYKPKQAKRQK